ncbi:hypothetical protein [Vibrio cincinnatiensis]|nr:hypothetical protein [Vibrio cincinnatiensis]
MSYNRIKQQSPFLLANGQTATDPIRIFVPTMIRRASVIPYSCS